MTIVDNYFPFDTGPGSAATAARWRLMARVWSTSGVVPNYLNNCNPTLAGSVVTIDTGALWIDGYYGEIDSPKTVSTTGNGTVVAHMDPNARQITVTFTTTVLTQSLTGVYEIPLARVTSGALTDIRQFASGGPLSEVAPGLMMDFGGTTAPAGWLLCNGASYLRSDYQNLFNAIGTNWGTPVDGNHFNVPDIRGRVPVGAGGGTGLSNRVLGATGGEENHVLQGSELTAHNHSASVNDPGHLHAAQPGFAVIVQTGSSLGLSSASVGTQAASNIGNPYTDNRGTGIGVGIGNSGGGQGHNTMQPFAVVLKVIKT
jgi:microcystin-dependent protein